MPYCASAMQIRAATAMAEVGSREYWRNPSHYPEDWHSRSVLAATLIEPGSRLLDLGCGPAMALKHHLARGCSYTGADLSLWEPEVQFADIDAGVFPAGKFD